MAKLAAPKQDVPTVAVQRNFGARGIAGLLAPVVRPAFTRRAPAAAALMADWPNLAGAALAALAAPVKFAGGTLTLACPGPTALELQHAAPDIIARLNLALGHRMVERLRFVQQALGPVEMPVARGPAKAPAPAPGGLPEGPLGEALARLYQAINAREIKESTPATNFHTLHIEENMPLTRRSTLYLVGASALMPAGRAALAADAADSPFAPRSLGLATAPVTAIEYFSLTCTHCAHFGNVTMPKVKPNLVDTGKLQIIYRDFPLDAVALIAAQVARSLPAAQYYPFIEALFASQDDWAFTPGIDYKESIFKYAALAGMDRPTYDAALANDKLKAFITNEEQDAETTYHVNSTPTFIINGKVMPGAMEYDDFVAAVANAAAVKT